MQKRQEIDIDINFQIYEFSQTNENILNSSIIIIFMRI